MPSSIAMRRVNDLLTRRTGYRLTKAASPLFDAEMLDIMRTVRPYTMTNEPKLDALITAVRYLTKHQIDGAMVECGVWRGGAMQAVAYALEKGGDTSRELYLYDTFEGMTPPTAEDVRFDGESAAKRLASHPKEGSAIWASASLEDVKAGFATVPYPADRVHFIKGPVESTIPEQAPQKIALLRLDTDWYESTAHELTHLYSRLVPGGVLILDDYDWWQGARQATDEFLKRTGEELLLIRTGTGRIAVKPGPV